MATKAAATPTKRATTRRATTKGGAAADTDDSASAPDSLDSLVDIGMTDDIEVPEELSFDTDTGEAREIDSVAIKLDGEVFHLYQPSDALLYLLGGTLAQNSDVAERFNAMMQLIQVCLDEAGNMYLRRRMFARDNAFDDEVLGKIIAVILDRWGGNLSHKNRAARRQEARAAKKQ